MNDNIASKRRSIKTIVLQGSLLPCFLGVLLYVSGCSSSANLDENFMRGHFRVPLDVKLLYRLSVPARAGTFGRENLLVKATYEFTPQQYKEYLERLKVESDWNKLPIAERLYLKLEEIDRFRKVQLKQFDRIKNGFYICETTTGRGILNDPKGLQSAFFRFPPHEPTKDFVLGVLDSEKRILYVVMKQDY